MCMYMTRGHVTSASALAETMLTLKWLHSASRTDALDGSEDDKENRRCRGPAVTTRSTFPLGSWENPSDSGKHGRTRQTGTRCQSLCSGRRHDRSIFRTSRTQNESPRFDKIFSQSTDWEFFIRTFSRSCSDTHLLTKSA